MSGTVTATSGIQLPDWVNQAALQNYNTAMGLSQQPYTGYTGTEIAPFTPLQNQAFSTIQNMPSTAPTINQAIGNISNMPALTNLPGATQSLLDPYLGSVESDTVSNIQRAAALQGQQVAAQAQQGGAYGGTRYGVEQATLDSETQRNIGQAVDQIQSQGWNTATQTALQQAGLGLNQAQTMAGLATTGQTAGLQLAGAQADVGGTQQQQQQATLAQQLANWQQQQNWPYQQLAVAQSALAGSPYGTTTTSSQPYTSSTLANALSTGAAAIPALSGLGSQINNLISGGGSGSQWDIPASGSSPITDAQALSYGTSPATTADYSDPFSADVTGNLASTATDTSAATSGLASTPMISDAASTGAGVGKGG